MRTLNMSESSTKAIASKTTCKQHVMLPHQLVSSVYNHSMDTFACIFLGAPGDLRDYWLRNADLMERHPELSGPDFCDHVLPYRIYGDSADSRRNQNFELTSMIPLLSAGSSTMDTRLVLSVRSTTATSPRASHIVNEVLAWSFEAMRR